MKVIRFLVSLLPIFLFTQCELMFRGDGPFDFCDFRNESEDTLTFCMSRDYPDTMMTAWQSTYHRNDCPPGEAIRIECEFNRKDMFEEYPIIQLFVYKKSEFYSYLKLPYPDIDSLEQRNFRPIELRRYELTREWLEEHDWTVVYP